MNTEHRPEQVNNSSLKQQRAIALSLHRFSVRYRAGLTRVNSANAVQEFLGTVKVQLDEQMQASGIQPHDFEAGS